MKSIFKNKRIMITGGSGFIGSYLLENMMDSNDILCYDIQFSAL